jgi:hypothetical protein
MRSVAVVLPASICAAIPKFLCNRKSDIVALLKNSGLFIFPCPRRLFREGGY